MIYRKTTYENEQGVVLHGLEPTDGIGPTIYRAEVNFQHRIGEEVIPTHAKINLECATIEEAFACVDEKVKQANKEIGDQLIAQRRQRLIVPNLVAQNGQAGKHLRLAGA